MSDRPIVLAQRDRPAPSPHGLYAILIAALIAFSLLAYNWRDQPLATPAPQTPFDPNAYTSAMVNADSTVYARLVPTETPYVTSTPKPTNIVVVWTPTVTSTPDLPPCSVNRTKDGERCFNWTLPVTSVPTPEPTCTASSRPTGAPCVWRDEIGTDGKPETE